MTKPSKTAVEQRLIGESCIACHACCHHLVLKLSHADLGRSRQTALAAEFRLALAGGSDEIRLMPRKKQDGGWDFYCPFLSGSGTCNIYDTRPDACRVFKRGSDECHEQRRLHR
jgi:Fe-S-cluster containining protein